MDNQPAVLLLSEVYGTLKEGISTIYRTLATLLRERKPNIRVSSAVLQATEDHKEDAKCDGVELLLPTVDSGDERADPSLHWLTFDHRVKYPDLPSNTRTIVGHTDGTSRAACGIKQDRFPDARVVLFIDDIPEDTEQYKGDEKAMGIGKKEHSILKDAEQADVVFSIGSRTFDHFENQFRAIPDDNLPQHKKFLPRPSSIFKQADAKYKATETKVVLYIGRIAGVEKLKGLDLVAEAMSIVAGKIRVKLRVIGVDEDDLQATEAIRKRCKSSNLQITFLPYGTQKDICKDMLQSHLVLMPSRAEPFGLVGLEAIAVGVPVLISDESGLADLINRFAPDHYHCIVETDVGFEEQGNVQNWARSIERVLRHCKTEFEKAAKLKKALMSTRYWEESERDFIDACRRQGRIPSETLTQELFTEEMNQKQGPDLFFDVTQMVSRDASSSDVAAGSSPTLSDNNSGTQGNEGPIGSSSDEESLQENYRILRVSEKLFDEEVLNNPEELEKRLLDFRQHVDDALHYFKLSCKAKLRIKRSVKHHAAKVHRVLFPEVKLRSRYGKLVKCFNLYSATLKKIEEGCVLCTLEFDGTRHFVTFLRGYRDGKLSETLTQELITEEMKQEEGTDLFIDVTLLVSRDASSSDVAGSEVSEAAVRPKTMSMKQLGRESREPKKPKRKTKKQLLMAEQRKKEKEIEEIKREHQARTKEEAQRAALREERRKQRDSERRESIARDAVSTDDREMADEGGVRAKHRIDIKGDVKQRPYREEDESHGDDEGIGILQELQEIAGDVVSSSSRSSSRPSTPSSGYSSSTDLTASYTSIRVFRGIGDLHRKVYDYKLACDICFLKDESRHGIGAYSYMGSTKHHCGESVLLARKKKTDDAFKKVRPRPQHNFVGTYKLCQQYQVSRQCHHGEPGCILAHNDIEIDLWTKEREGKFNRAELMFQLCKTKVSEADAIQQLQQKHGGVFRFLCKECFLSTPEVLRDSSQCDQHFQKGQRQEDMGLLVHTRETSEDKTQYTLIMPYPQLTARQIPLFCAYRNKCGSEECGRAHSQVEMDVWMLERQCGTPQRRLVYGAGSDKITSSAGASERPSNFPLLRPLIGEYYCKLCHKTCNSRVMFDRHCSSKEHQTRLRSDECDDWQYRSPPWIGRNEEYRLCQRHIDGSCPYDGIEDRHNICPYAHSQEELDEWKERQKHRRLNMEMAQKQGLFSYMDRLRGEYENTTDGPSVIADSLEGVIITSTQREDSRLEKKKETCTWAFKVTSKEPLERVALLYNDHRTHFSLHGPNLEENCQIAEGKEWFDFSDNSYNVTIEGTSQMFGVFSQWVIFDFGKRPVIKRSLALYVGSVGPEHEHVKPDPPDFERWHSGNRSIVKFAEKLRPDDPDEALLAKYKEPTDEREILARLSQQKKELDEIVYKARMHDLLYLEELARNKTIASIRKETTLELFDRIESDILLKGGTLYTKLNLQDQLNEDTPAGKLILTDVNTVLLAPKGSDAKEVYEAAIVQSKGFEGRRQKEIYIQLSRRCCQDLNLSSGTTAEFDVRLQLNRLHFCYMHYAVDNMAPAVLHTIFPIRKDMSAESLPTPQVQEVELNAKQSMAVRRILSRKGKANPPVVIYGPFGTGKTRMMASAALQIIKQPGTNVLIATHSNSAADLYIKYYFHRYVESGHPRAKPLRVYAMNRRQDTVDKTVMQYCKLDPDTMSFAMPDMEDIKGHRIVIVTNTTSLDLIRMNIEPGHFTHIFLDEAAQALECETILPLCLADSTTRIVLAGDHRQISPRVYATEACNLLFDKSLLERMVQRYIRLGKGPTQKVENPFLFMFTDNYRCCEEILRFLSDSFYGGLKSMGQPRHPSPRWYPLTFFSAEGEDKTGDYSTSHYNMAEVLEISERVKELLKDWPEEWGPPNLRDIGVITSYHNQLQLIRRELRKERLGDVTVEMVTNIQGKQFRAVFISTVRTRATCDPNDDKKSYGFLSDSKLLNTAMTRAQSLVAVVGDPHALCSIGECQKVWQNFILKCKDNNSLFPETLSMSQIYERSDSISLNPEAQPFTPRGSTTGVQSLGASSPPYGLVPPAERFTKIDEPDDIIRELILQTLEDEDEEEANRFKARTFDPNELIMVPSQTDPAHVYLRYSSGKPISVRRPVPLKPERPGLGVGSPDREYDSGEDEAYDVTQHEVQEEISDQCFCINYPLEELENLLQTQPNRYRRCRLAVEGVHKALGKVIGTEEEDIVINGRKNRGLGWANDEVVVEILDNDDEETEQFKTLPDHKIGKVVGVIKPAVSLRLRKFVCIVDSNNPTMMVPINTDAPKLVTYFGKEDRRRPNKVRVYRYMSDDSIKFNKFEDVDPTDPYKKLFVVRFLKWTPRYPFPLGVVTDVIIPDKTIDVGMKILNNKFNVPSKYRGRVAEDVNRRYFGDWQVPKVERNRRKDLSKTHTVFTVDQSQSMDLSHAFSIEENQNGTHTVGLHVADVSYFVPVGSDLDNEAKERSLTLYPKTGKPPVHMIPKRLSEGVCSLLPNSDRLALSFFVTLKSDGNIVDEPRIERCIVHSRAQLSYAEAEDIIAGKGTSSLPQDVKDSVRNLHKVAVALRKQRLGQTYLYHQPDEDKVGSAWAHAMEEEIMILANARVAQVLLQRFPQTTPLRQQQPPKTDKLEDWKKHHAGLSGCSAELSKTLPNEESMGTQLPDIPLLKEIWDKVSQAASKGDLDAVQQFVCTDENHPTLARALLQLRKMQGRSAFLCAGHQEPEHYRHYSLEQAAYTYFSSPIRRYIDIVVHRLVLALIAKKPSPYEPDEINDICSHYNNMENDARAYERATLGLKFAHDCLTKPEVVYPVIDTVNQQEIQLLMPFPRHTELRQRHVRFSLLKPAELPTLEGEGESVVIRWEQRIYDTAPDWTKLPPPSDLKRLFQLDSEQHVIKISDQQWQRLVQCVQGGDMGAIQNVVADIDRVVKQPRLHLGQVIFTDVSSEALEDTFVHFCNFKMKYKPGQVVKVQLTGDIQKGLLSPCIQLFNLTPKMDVCLDHRRDAVTRFAVPATRSVANITRYRSIEEYQDRWLPIMAVEAAHCSMENNESVTVHNTYISWTKQSEGEGYYGEFSLPQKFCKDRGIDFIQDYECNVSQTEEYTDDDENKKSLGYICVRYTGVSAAVTPGGQFDIAAGKSDDESPLVCWVGHCLVMPGVEYSARKDGDITVPIKLHQHLMAFPDTLLHRGTSIPATIEIITKTLPDRRMEDAVRWLSSSSVLVQEIATGTHITAEDNKLASEVTIKSLEGFPSLNQDQEEAVKQAIKKPFTLIHGPPGTGKTVTGVHIAYYLVEMNKVLQSDEEYPPQVLYCGPSNKAVDVVTGYIKKIKGDIKIVRMYSEMIEKQEFPIPFDPTHRYRCKSDKESKITNIHDDVALHHLIRKPSDGDEPSNPYRDEIINMETNFKDHNYHVTDEEISYYKDLILKAKTHELRQKHVILCTCTAAASPKMGMATNIEQCIVDECGMCTEPESFVPIVGAPVEKGSMKFHNPEQVILIGDHQQLRPIVLEKSSEQLGLNTSLFKRYASKAIMLKTQYRMHEAICNFPSRMFYKSKLHTDKSVTARPRKATLDRLWPGGADMPTAFCHVVGKEEVQTVKTEDGSQMSRSNEMEADMAVKMAISLVREHGINPQDVMLLSQYRAQCALIKEKLEAQRINLNDEKQIGVDSVVAAQGSEWGYVIFSTVRSLPMHEIDEQYTSPSWLRKHLGSIGKENQVNVAITRAKRGLCIVGNKSLLKVHPLWKKLISDYESQNCLVDNTNFFASGTPLQTV